ncbi:hypothetical protein H4R21_000341 [Coemansia helicoidea]|uniref:Uncharacterized protein n=2 Tax=Coemansia TaxID=4863 RepID=A0ACC1LHN3_9FUNG|nr:hypothetical protein H4R21_000341 [Coemansia helicoidea]
MPACSYVIRYFGLAGRAEPSRLMLTAAKADWADENPDWPAAKADQPFGQLPVLVEKSGSDDEPDFVVGQSGTIERYLGRKLGFLPADLKQAALQEQFHDQMGDMILAFYHHAFAPESIKEEKGKAFDATLEKFVQVQTELLKSNGNSGYLFGDSFSYADAVSYGYYKHLMAETDKYRPGIAEHVAGKLTPEIIKHIVAIENDPAVKEQTAKWASVAAIVQA